MEKSYRVNEMNKNKNDVCVCMALVYTMCVYGLKEMAQDIVHKLVSETKELCNTRLHCEYTNIEVEHTHLLCDMIV